MKNSLICEKSLKESGLTKKEVIHLLELSKTASIIGGKILMENYGKIKHIESKDIIGDLVTNADTTAEKKIIEYLSKSTKDIGILAEESGHIKRENSLMWCIDPLDGTTNYAHGYPLFGTSVGLVFNDSPILGAINIPFLNEIYYGAPSVGSFCNDETISVSRTNQLINSLLVTGFSYDRRTNKDNNYAEFCWLTHKTRGVRRGGAASVDLAFVAKGRLDGYWERGLKEWDLAAGIPIVEMAGGIVTNYKNSNYKLSNGEIIATNIGIKNELKMELSEVKSLEIESLTIKNSNTR